MRSLELQFVWSLSPLLYQHDDLGRWHLGGVPVIRRGGSASHNGQATPPTQRKTSTVEELHFFPRLLVQPGKVSQIRRCANNRHWAHTSLHPPQLVIKVFLLTVSLGAKNAKTPPSPPNLHRNTIHFHFKLNQSHTWALLFPWLLKMCQRSWQIMCEIWVSLALSQFVNFPAIKQAQQDLPPLFTVITWSHYVKPWYSGRDWLALK